MEFDYINLDHISIYNKDINISNKIKDININKRIIIEYNKLAIFESNIFYIDVDYFKRLIDNDVTNIDIVTTLNKYFISIDSNYVAVKEKHWKLSNYYIPYSFEIICIRTRMINVFTLI